MAADVDFHGVITRDSSTGMTTGYVNGTQQWSFSGPDSVPASNVVHFFMDDSVTNHYEAMSGSVDFIRIYDGALSAGDVALLAGGGVSDLPLGHSV